MANIEEPNQLNIEQEIGKHFYDDLQKSIDEFDCLPNDSRNESQQEKPKGRRRKYPDQNRKIRKFRANTNQDYVNAKGKMVEAKEFLGNNFNCNCPKKCTEKVPLETRRAEFDKFWSSGSYEARCAMIQEYVEEIPKLRSYSKSSKRNYSRKHFLANVQVCKRTFLNTLNISQSRVDFALDKYRTHEPLNDKRGQKSGGNNALTDDKLEQMTDFINTTPKYITDYRQRTTTENSTTPHLNLELLYNIYKGKHRNGVSLTRFKISFLKHFNVKLKKSQKDFCLCCDLFKIKTSN